MEFHRTVEEGNRGVVVFALGWAADHRIVEHIRPSGWDVLTVYNYGENVGAQAGLADELAGYSRKLLFAWSFGVWAAEHIFRNTAFERAVALNGTPFPVHDLYGIEPRRMAVTIRGLRSGGMEAFDRRAYGEHFDRMAGLLSPRPLEKNIAELELLARLGAQEYEPAIQWDKAVVGSGDVIFPPENMLRFWGSRAEELPLPHYPFAAGDIITRELECR